MSGPGRGWPTLRVEAGRRGSELRAGAGSQARCSHRPTLPAVPTRSTPRPPAPPPPPQGRIKAVRQALYEALVSTNPDKDWGFVVQQIGMFT